MMSTAKKKPVSTKKSGTKKSGSSKKAGSSNKSSKKGASASTAAAIATDVEAAFAKHTSAKSISVSPASADAMLCPPGKSPHVITYKKNGQWVTVRICI
jgi:hypothetical protein